MTRLWLLAGVVLSGCSFVDVQRKSSLSYQNLPVSHQVWESIIPGVTDEQWLLRHIGTPASVEQVQKERVFVYPLLTTTSSSTQVFLFYSKREIVQSPVQKKIYLAGNRVTRVETRYPEPASTAPIPETASAQGNSDTKTDDAVDSGSAGSKDATSEKDVKNSDSTPYGETDPFSHPWPLNRSL